MEKLVAHVPGLVISDFLKEHIDQSKSARTGFEAHFKQIQATLEEKQVCFNYLKIKMRNFCLVITDKGLLNPYMLFILLLKLSATVHKGY